MKTSTRLDFLFEMRPGEPDWPAYVGPKKYEYDPEIAKEVAYELRNRQEMDANDIAAEQRERSREALADEQQDLPLGEAMRAEFAKGEFAKLSLKQLHELWKKNHTEWHDCKRDPLRREHLVKLNRRIDKRIATIRGHTT